MNKAGWGAMVAAITLLTSQPGMAFSKSDSAASFSLTYQFLKEEIVRPQASSLYEKSLIGLAFLFLGDAKLARAQLEKGIGIWSDAEEVQMGGSPLWLALLALQYERVTGDPQFRPTAEKICDQFCALPRYHGLPSMGAETLDGIPWMRIVSLENARLAIAVLRLASTARYQKEAQRLEAALKKITPLPAGSFLLIGFEADSQTGAASQNFREYQLAKNVYLATEENLDRSVVAAGSTEELLRVYWDLMAASRLPQEEKTARYENLRRVVQSAENISEWLDENNLPRLNSEEDWFLPEGKKSLPAGHGIVSVCWDLFRGRWNPLGAELPQRKQAPVAKAAAPSQLFEMARIQLVAGNTGKAEMLAQECVDQYGHNPACADQVASAWLILGKIYHDRSQAASERLMFTTADDLQHKRDVAFNKVRTGYPTASVEAGSGFFSYVAEVIQNLYN